MDGSLLFALTVHVVGIAFWVGGLFTVGRVMASAGEEPALRARVGAIARRVAIATDAAAGAAIVGGVALLLMRSWDLRQPWMHMKLTFVVGLLAVHGIVRVRAKKLANGGPAPSAKAPVAIALLAIVIIALVIFKPLAH
jgi:putative membrane protein